MWIDGKEYVMTRNHRAYEKAKLDASYEAHLKKLKSGELRLPLSPRERFLEIDPDDPRIEVIRDGRSVMAMLNPPKVFCSTKETEA